MLQLNYPTMGVAECAILLKRSKSAIMHKAQRLGLKVNKIISHAKVIDTHKKNTLLNGFKDISTWKRLVWIRDNYTCQDCGIYEPTIVVAHHIIPKMESAENILNIDNGITLCPNCHAKRHLVLKNNSSKRLNNYQKGLILKLHSDGNTIQEIEKILLISTKTIHTYLKKFNNKEN